MAMRKRVQITRRKPVEEAEIIVIPMIDVMMFLLFFFMVSSLAMVVQSGLPVNLPKASTSSQHSTQNITITIMRDNRIFLNTAVVTLDKLKDGLKALNVTDQNLVIINADKMVTHGLVVGAMDEARKAGVTRFAIATDKG
ncbi:MAG: outer rane transport energization protein ExbD [Chthonomonadaceae bacterium]|nr:outer rane transport energization protein ExbD [Chthonomonadaceae bacterium]